MPFSEFVSPSLPLANLFLVLAQELTSKRNTHVSFTNAEGDDIVGIVKSFSNGKYHIQTRSELKTEHTHEVEESKVKELKVSDPEPCPIAGSK